MAMRRAAAKSTHHSGYELVESGREPLDPESLTGETSIVEGGGNFLNRIRSQGRRLLGKRLCRLLESALCIVVCLVVLDVLYLMFQAMTFKDPCLLAREVKYDLETNPRVAFVKGGKSELPKIIHQQWKTDRIPEGVFQAYHARWKALFPEPEYKHMLWTDASGRELIAKEFPWFLEAYDNYLMNIQRADAMRYFILYYYGGVYADLDYEPFVNFWEFLPSDRVSLIESPYKVNEKVQNSLMASPKEDPFWNVTFKLLYERRKSHKVLSSTGPSFMDAVLKRLPDPSWVHILPCENFHRIPLGEAGKDAPYISRLARAFLAYTPLSKTCGDWEETDDCQFGLHHNAVSYMNNMGDGWFDFLFNF